MSTMTTLTDIDIDVSLYRMHNSIGKLCVCVFLLSAACEKSIGS
jgi:hypothetical protein